MATTGDPRDRVDALASTIRLQLAEAECWERAELVVRTSTLRDRLDELGVAVTPEVAAALMAASMLLASSSEEFGGDYRDALGDLAALGLELYED
jgi:hypothetical protein